MSQLYLVNTKTYSVSVETDDLTYETYKEALRLGLIQLSKSQSSKHASMVEEIKKLSKEYRRNRTIKGVDNV